MFLLFWCLYIVTKNTFLLFWNLVNWYINDIFLLSHDVLILEIFIMLFIFLNNVFCIDHQCIFFSWKICCIFYNYNFFLLTIVFLLIFCTVIFLIIFFYFVMHIFRIFMNNTDFVSSFYDVFHICCYDILFSVIIHMLSIFCFLEFQISLFLIR